MKLATWNVNSLTVRLPQVLDWLLLNPVDVLVLQETKTTDDKFPRAAIPGFEDDMARVITGTVNGVRVVGAYLPNGQAPDSDKFVYKMRWLDALREWLRAELLLNPKLVLMGDYNITADDRDVWDPVGLAGTIHCTPQEREHLQALVGLGMVDAFRLFEQPEKSYSWWDYREMAFRRNRGLRIDHILVGESLKAFVLACHIDKLPRKNERPSDHAPVVVELAVS